jgi:hypothetical protein
MQMFWALKLNFDVDILAFFGYFLNFAIFGHTGLTLGATVVNILWS